MHRRDLFRIAAGASLGLRSYPGRTQSLAAAKPPDWRALGRRLGERLIEVRSPLTACAEAGGAGAEALFARIKNPYFLGDEPGLTQTLGWTDAWTSRASDYAVAAESAADVTAAIDFAQSWSLPLTVKGGGHSYFGNSNRAGSLLVWLRRMQTITMHDDFVGAGCSPNSDPVPAVSIGAGAIWGQVYDAVAVRGGRYVQGGGCLTVGVAGLVMGGGFGSLSKQFGTAAANLLEAEVITADRKVRTVNRMQDPELFFALRGGGGGTFAVMTRLTLRTHVLPQTIGAVIFTVQAKSDSGWRELVARMIAFYSDALFNPIWGEQIRFSPDRTLSLSMLFHGLNEAQAREIWAPFLTWIAARSDLYVLSGNPMIIAVPARRFWDAAFLRELPGIVLADDRPEAPVANVFWASNLGETGQVLHAYQSAWMPADLLATANQPQLVGALVAGSAIWSMTLHTNKGLAGGSADAWSLTQETATNPAVLDAFALLICAADAPPAWPGIAGHEPDVATGRKKAEHVRRAMKPIQDLVPDAGAYVSEADYFDEDWQRRYWGTNYPRLLAGKRRYDPNSLFSGHHTVGSAQPP
jgi:FAD/FMN-containing dehydrogenase